MIHAVRPYSGLIQGPTWFTVADLGRLRDTFDKFTISDDYDVAVKREIDRTILHAQKRANANRGEAD